MNFNTSNLSVKNRLRRSKELKIFFNRKISTFQRGQTTDKVKPSFGDDVKASEVFLDHEYLKSLLIKRKPLRSSKKSRFQTMTLDNFGIHNTPSHIKNNSSLNSKPKRRKCRKGSPLKSESRNSKNPFKQISLDANSHDYQMTKLYHPNMSLEDERNQKLLDSKKSTSSASEHCNSFSGGSKPHRKGKASDILSLVHNAERNRASTSHSKTRKRTIVYQSRGKSREINIKITDNKLSLGVRDPKNSTIFHRSSSPRKGSSSVMSNKRVLRLEKVYKDLVRKSLGRRSEPPKFLEISNSQQKLCSYIKGFDQFFQTMQGRNSGYKEKPHEGHTQEIDDGFEDQVCENNSVKSRNSQQKIISVRFNSTKDYSKDIHSSERSHLESVIDARYSTKNEIKRPQLDQLQAGSVKFSFAKNAKKRKKAPQNPNMNIGDGLMDKYNQFKHQFGRKYIIHEYDPPVLPEEGISQKEMINYYLTSRPYQINSHLTDCVKRIIKIQYKGYLLDIEKIGRFCKTIESQTSSRLARKKIGIEIHRIEKRLSAYKKYTNLAQN
ncbi:unnamed protein product [Moneuplotes crassus]|uniref:Uncharacterized protein n=1 Tax=Euplotes crassus TaxID=5936 RepID=A0AAD1X819_EUPCR|nr:unnamed protein product [Moneuplotes crassus]